jgi:transcriptional regulator with XRE-family HTH domain
MSQEDLQINGDLLRLRREARGWVLSDMATRACMSVKQIRQLEEGGISSFYSEAVKLTSAKKVGALLGLSAEEVVVQETLTSSGIEEITTEIVDVPVVEVEAIDVLLAEQPTDDVASEVSVEAEVSHPAVPAKDAKSKIWVTAALFAAALAVAAYMQPKEEEVAEPAPPLQAVPSDAVDPASVASASEAAASATESQALAAVAASAPRAAMPASSAVASVVRAASAAVTAASIAPAASKAP